MTEIKLPPLPEPVATVKRTMSALTYKHKTSIGLSMGENDLVTVAQAQDYATAAIEADRKTTKKQLTAYRGVVNSLEARLAHLQAQHDELKKSTNPDLLASERAANAMLTEELEADRKRRGEPVAPEGFRLIAVNDTFDSLMFWLDRCEQKGHLENCADLTEPWEKFEYREVEAPQPAELVKVVSDAEILALAASEHLGHFDKHGKLETCWSQPCDIDDEVLAFARALLARYGQSATDSAGYTLGPISDGGMDPRNQAEPVKKRKAFICPNCEGVYADQPVSQCDCVPDKNEFIEGTISYPATQPAAPKENP